MLVLSRRPGERFTISGGIEIKVIDVRRGCVRLGIEAPRSVTVLRNELVDREFEPPQSDRQRQGAA